MVASSSAAIAVYTFTGSHAGWAIFTALLAGSTVIGPWNAVAPQAAAHPTFMPLDSLAVALVVIAVLALLDRLDVDDHFRAHSLDTTGQRVRDHSELPLPRARNKAPCSSEGRSSAVPLGPQSPTKPGPVRQISSLRIQVINTAPEGTNNRSNP